MNPLTEYRHGKRDDIIYWSIHIYACIPPTLQRILFPFCLQSDATASSNSSYAHSFAHIVLTQSSYSLAELTDIDPFDPAALLGNIGGFWGK